MEKGGEVLPIEVKSGRDFKSHAALNNLMSEREFAIPDAWVLNGSRQVETTGRIVYFPVYFLMFLVRNGFDKPMVYKVD